MQRRPALLAAAFLLAAAGCVSNGDEDEPAPSPSAAARGNGVFLAADECSTRGKTGFAEVPCTSERAYASVVARHYGDRESGTRCPDVTDFVLDLTERTPGAGSAEPDGYACMRKLGAPHPGDPGGGGGPYTILGDCVYRTEKGRVRETACDGTGGQKAEFKIVKAVAKRTNCPESTALYVSLPGAAPVGCARRT